MSDHLDWNEAGAMDYVRGRAMGFLNRAAMEVTRRAKQLLSISGTGVHPGKSSIKVARAKFKAAARAENRKYVKDFNLRNAAAIKSGHVKKLRFTRSGKVTDRAKRRRKRPT